MNPTAPSPLIQNEDHGQHYGALLSSDPRDHALAAYTSLAQAGAPEIEKYYPNLSGIPIWMQNQLGACVGHAAGKGRQVASFHESGATKVIPFSARYAYALSKCFDGIPNIQGTYPPTTAKVLRDYGCATEATMPNDTTLDHATYTYGGSLANVPAAAIAEGKAGPRITNWAFADITEQGIKAAIQFAGENKGFVFMLAEIDKAWWTRKDGISSWAAADIFPLRAPSDPATLGGHETMPYAFDVVNGRTIIIGRNSWSDQWGKGTPHGVDGDYWLYLDEWLPHIRQVIVAFDIPTGYQSLGWTYTFTRGLHEGMSGSDVVALQHALRIDGEFPEGQSFTGYFGPTTLAAVNAFQAKYAAEILQPLGLAHPTGTVGAATLKKLNGLFAK